MALIIVLLGASSPLLAQEGSTERARIEESGDVLKEIFDIPDGIPKSVLNGARCVIESGFRNWWYLRSWLNELPHRSRLSRRMERADHDGI